MTEQLKVITLDAATGETIEREFSSEELEEFELNKHEFLAIKEAKEFARASALAKLAAIGLTEEEIAAL